MVAEAQGQQMGGLCRPCPRHHVVSSTGTGQGPLCALQSLTEGRSPGQASQTRAGFLALGVTSERCGRALAGWIGEGGPGADRLGVWALAVWRVGKGVCEERVPGQLLPGHLWQCLLLSQPATFVCYGLKCVSRVKVLTPEPLGRCLGC